MKMVTSSRRRFSQWTDCPPLRLAEDRSIIKSIGNTPLLNLSSISREVAPVQISAKAEWFNPGGSVKDRPALNIIREGERSGKLTRDKILIDATSGNTGIAYAMIGAALGYKIKLTIPANAGVIRKRILRAYGAELILTSLQEGSDGAIIEAQRIYRENPEKYFYADQYNNPANPQAHYDTTAPEIIEQTFGGVTHFVAGLGTSGTFIGTGRRLKKFNPAIRTISFQPNSPMHGMEGMKHMATSIVPGIYDSDFADEYMEITTEDAQMMVKRLATEEGLLVGVSGGAAVVASLNIARKLPSGHVVTVLPDNGMKYLDEPFWEM